MYVLNIKCHFLTTNKSNIFSCFNFSVTKGNVLFDFLQIEAGRCVLLSSKDTVEGPLSVVVHNFRQSATLTHHILHKAANGRVRCLQFTILLLHVQKMF